MTDDSSPTTRFFKHLHYKHRQAHVWPQIFFEIGALLDLIDIRISDMQYFSKGEFLIGIGLGFDVG